MPRFVPPSPRYTPPAPRYVPPVTHHVPPVTHFAPPVMHHVPPVTHFAPPPWRNEVVPAPHVTVAPVAPAAVAPAAHAASVTDSHTPPGRDRSNQRQSEAAATNRARMWRNGENDESRLLRQAHSGRSASLHLAAAANFTPVTVQPAHTATAKPANAGGAVKPAEPTSTAKPAKADGKAQPAKVSVPATTISPAAGAAPLRQIVTVAIPGPAPVPTTVVRPVVEYRPAPTVAAPAHRASRPAAAPRKPAAPEETFPGAFGEPMVLARGAWQGLSLQAATELKVPISLLVAVGVFLLVQALVDRRDPKVAAAPERGTDDTVGFQ